LPQFPHLWHHFEFLFCVTWLLFPHQGCYFGSGCNVINQCFIPCNVSNAQNSHTISSVMFFGTQPVQNPAGHRQYCMHYLAKYLALGQCQCVCPFW
jgi:hypothetical protein